MLQEKLVYTERELKISPERCIGGRLPSRFLCQPSAEFIKVRLASPKIQTNREAARLPLQSQSLAKLVPLFCAQGKRGSVSKCRPHTQRSVVSGIQKQASLQGVKSYIIVYIQAPEKLCFHLTPNPLHKFLAVMAIEELEGTQDILGKMKGWEHLFQCLGVAKLIEPPQLSQKQTRLYRIKQM